jgi:dihydropteroate synthase
MTDPAPPARARFRLRLGDRVCELGDRTLILAVVNCTPDSFYGASRQPTAAAAVQRYHEAIAEGADWVDVGGESTRPGAEAVSAEEEWARIAPVLEAARRARHPVPLSVDTTKAAVAERALDAGATILNDVSALRFEPRLAELAARYGAALIVMHMRGTPRTMQAAPHYDDLMGEIRRELATAIGTAVAHGMPRDQLLLDPGIGFGKTAAHNLEILRRLGELASLDRPLLVGCSRKSFIGAVLDLPPEERLEGTLAAHVLAASNGAHIVRAHDIRAHVRALRVADAIRAAAPTP